MVFRTRFRLLDAKSPFANTLLQIEYGHNVMRLQVVLTTILILLAVAPGVGCRGNGPAAPLPEAAETTAVFPAPTSIPLTPTPLPAVDAPPTDAPPTAVTPVAGGRSIGDPYTPELGNTGYDVQQYTIRIALDPAVTQIQAVTTIDLVTTLDNLAKLSLDFIGYDVAAVAVGQTPATYQRADDKLLVDLPAPAPAGTPLAITVTYSGEPVKRPSPYIGVIDGLGLRHANEASIYVLSEPDGARFWFPANDHPRDKATFRFEITVPPGLTAAANGELLAIEQDGVAAEGQAGHTFIWEHNRPMATYLATIAVGEYERLESTSAAGVPIRSYLFPEYRADFLRATAVTGEAIDWMSGLFGPYPFEAIGFYTANVFGVSLETQTMVLLSTTMLNEITVVHELAHMWFGNWVSLDSWAEMWRNEGFATYVSLMWLHRDDPEGLELEMAGIRAMVEDNRPSFALGAPPPDSLFSSYIYFGGAVMVHELRQTVGDDAFFAGLRLYFQRYGGDVASDADFQAVMEEASGQSLDAFFARWLQ